MEARIEYSTIHDISMALKKDMVVYPNNPSFGASKVRGSSSLLHKISMGTHSGTHVDAPNHVLPSARGIDFFPLSDFIGQCRVIDMTDIESVITAADLQDVTIEKGDRILFKTKNSDVDINEAVDFHDDFVALAGDAAEFLAEKETNVLTMSVYAISL